jgi:hypothetical protein
MNKNKYIDSLIESYTTFFNKQFSKNSYLTILWIPIAGFIGIFVCIYEEVTD